MFIATAIVAALHVAFAAGESIGWTAFASRFGYSKEKIEHTRALALNQGAYNLGVAVMLGIALGTGDWSTVQVILGFIIAMAIVGAVSVRWTIFVVQGLPAVIALGLVMTSGEGATTTEAETHSSVVAPAVQVQTDVSERAWKAPPRFIS